ncbi:MAG: exodeoxyribonuclease III [Candidatus Marinimicrobia bacterium]|nr:exodeoxyribonuclease III [Candidatus Neomarinimicrobiota bacterium]
MKSSTWRVATFNANSIRSRLAVVLEWLAAHVPDVLCLQETKVTDDLFPAAAFEAAGYPVVYRGQKSYNGVAICARTAPDRVQYGFDDGGPADASRLICASWGAVTVLNTYVPQGRALDHEMYAYKLEWFRRLRALLDRQARPDAAWLWAGDMNVAREPRDVHHPERMTQHVCYHADVRRAFEDTLGWGFTDVFRERHPEAGQYTFYDYRDREALAKGHGWRIDYLLASPPLAARLRDAFIDLAPRRQPKCSDHTFLVADFDA